MPRALLPHISIRGYNFPMNLDLLRNQTIVLFGQPRSLGEDEFDRLLKSAAISRKEGFDDTVAAVIEGKLVNPVEQMELDRLYETHGVVPVDINVFEKALCSQIEPDRIMMSLKLGGDRERLHRFLQNPHIDDAFFLKLLSLYDWQNEGFFDSDENRDVTAALIKRFYADIDRNHNIQYATLGILHLLAQSDNAELIRTIGLLSPVRHAIDSRDRQMRAVLEALAIHPHTDARTVKLLIRQGDDALRIRVAGRPDLDAGLQRELNDLGDGSIRKALAANPALDDTLLRQFGDDPTLQPIVYAHMQLDEARFETACLHAPEAIASNPSLTEPMQRKLAGTSDEVRTALAANPVLQVAEALYAFKEPAVLRALAVNLATPESLLHALAESGHYDAGLAANPRTPSTVLTSLFKKGEIGTLAALAANEATPVEALYQLQLDSRFARAVRTNPAFGAHIQKENIGWL